MMLEIVLSIAVLLCLIVFVLGCLDCLFKKKNRFEPFGIRNTAQAEHNAAFSVDIFDADSISEQVIIEPLPDILSKVSTVPVLRPRITCTDRGTQEASLSLLSAQRSFPRNHLTYLNEIGSGWFGKAIQSEAVQITPASYTSHVIVKILRDDASKQEQKQFIEEVSAFRCLEHTNLISLLGQCSETTPYLVILEYAAHGDLKTYLVQNRQDLGTLINTNRLVSFALDAASGLACLHRHDYIHNDVAARNCLIMSDYTLKIGDYGISDHLFKDDYYNNGTELLPVRWMAPEILIQKDGIWVSQKCTKISDIWSFGVLLWEICSLGQRPYDNLTNESVLQNVVQNRLMLPSDVNTKLPFKVKIWSLMIQCWEEPSQRMNVEQTHHILEQLKIQLDATIAVSNFDEKWNNLERNQVKRVSINSENRSTSVNTIAKNVTFAADTPSLLYEIKTPNKTSIGEVIIDIDNSNARNNSRDHNDLSASKSTVQSLHAAVDHSFVKSQQTGSMHPPQYQVMLENKFKMISISPSHLTPSSSLDQQLLTSAISVSQGPGSISQFFSPPSSPSSEYLTVSETNCATNIQEETAKELWNDDRDLSSDLEKLPLYELIDEILPQDFIVGKEKGSLVNNNNIASKCDPLPETKDFNVHFYEPPEVQDEDFSDFKAALTAGSNSLFNVAHVNEGDLCNKHSSLFKTNVASASDKDDSELVASLEYTTNINNDSNANAKSLSISSCTLNSIPVTLNSVASSISHGHIVHSVDLLSEPKLKFSTNIAGSGSETFSKNISEVSLDNKTDSQSHETSLDLENKIDITSYNMHMSQQDISEETIEAGQDQNIISSGLIQPGSKSEDINLQSESFTSPQDHSRTFDEKDPFHSSPTIEDNFEMNENGESSDEYLDHKLPIFSDNGVNTDTVQVSGDSIIKNESNSAESGILSHSIAESSTNNAVSNSEVDSSTYLSDSPIDSQLSDSSVAILKEVDVEQDTWPISFKSNLYRCSHIDLTTDIQNAVEEEKNFKSIDGHDCHEDLQTPLNSDSENSNSDSEQEYNCFDQDNVKQPMTSSPDTAATNTDSNAQIETSSPVEFDDYALQIASEIYLSRGLKSPRAYEIPPLETIPEHQPMPEIQEESNYTPSDTSSVEVRYDELFGSDSYEWDDFYGDPLIGRDISLQNSIHQHNPSFREHDISDWSMDIDSENAAGGISVVSSQSEVSLSTSTPSELPSQADTSSDSGSRLFSSYGSESLTSFTKSNDSSRETLLSSLLSHLQSPILASVSSVDKNNFYSLTQKYDLDTDSSTDALRSIPEVLSSSAVSPSSFTHHVEDRVPGNSSTLLPSDSKMSDQHADLMPRFPESSLSVNKSCTYEEFDISSDKSYSVFGQESSLLDHTSNLTTNEDSYVSTENIDIEDQIGAVNFKPRLNLLDSDNALENSLSVAYDQDVSEV